MCGWPVPALVSNPRKRAGQGDRASPKARGLEEGLPLPWGLASCRSPRGPGYWERVQSTGQCGAPREAAIRMLNGPLWCKANSKPPRPSLSPQISPRPTECPSKHPPCPGCHCSTLHTQPGCSHPYLQARQSGPGRPVPAQRPAKSPWTCIPPLTHPGCSSAQHTPWTPQCHTYFIFRGEEGR